MPQHPDGPDISSCSVTLMPWSPFPCAFNTTAYYGIPGQRSSYCYTDPSHASKDFGPTDLVKNLTTDYPQFNGFMPQRLCQGIEMPEVVKLLLTADFRVAHGRQFDRAYSFLIGQATVSAGTGLVQTVPYRVTCFCCSHWQPRPCLAGAPCWTEPLLVTSADSPPLPCKSAILLFSAGCIWDLC